MKPRCVLLIPDAGPINSLWTAGRLDLLPALDMPIVMIDEIVAEVTGDPNYPQDREVKAFLDKLQGDRLTIEETFVGSTTKQARLAGTFKSGKSMGEAAIAEFMSDGIEKYVANGDPVLMLFEDSDFRSLRFMRKPDNVHLLSTVAMLRGMERFGMIPSAEQIIAEMTNPEPPKPARVFRDLPDGYEEEAAEGSTWAPTGF